MKIDDDGFDDEEELLLRQFGSLVFSIVGVVKLVFPISTLTNGLEVPPMFMPRREEARTISKETLA